MENQNSQQTAYANILDEARARILSINTIMSGTSSLPQWLTAELGYLQLRMLCELVALGCLTLHGDIEKTKDSRLQKAYAADKIIKDLERLHPDFYPRPINCKFSPGQVHIEQVESGFLTKSELLALYYECGDHLHRGSLSRINTKQPPKIEKMLEWGAKFLALLSQHRIYAIGEVTQYICFLSSEQAGGNALVAIAQAQLSEVGA